MYVYYDNVRTPQIRNKTVSFIFYIGIRRYRFVFVVEFDGGRDYENRKLRIAHNKLLCEWRNPVRPLHDIKLFIYKNRVRAVARI